jgi:hypothetical protein
MIRQVAISTGVVLTLLFLAPAQTMAEEEECTLTPRSACFGVASVKASLSTHQAGDHPDLSFDVAIRQDPETEANTFGLHDGYATTRDIRFNLPPGLIGDPNILGISQQCTEQELVGTLACPIASQIGVSTIAVYQPTITHRLREPLYMMQPPGGDVVARVGTVAGNAPTFIDLRVRSESDYGLVAEVKDAPAVARLIELESTLWGVPAAPSHDTERCYPAEALGGCVASEPRPPGSRPLPFLTNPTRCGISLKMGVNASSWTEPEFDPAKEVTASFPVITGCNNLPFGPSLAVVPTSRQAGKPTGADITLSLSASEGAEVLEPSQMREIEIAFPEGLAVNPGTADGLVACNVKQVHIGERVPAECPNASKLATTEFEIPVLERNLKGGIYLRDPEPESEDPVRIWIVADDLGLHVKLPGTLHLDEETGQIDSVVLDPRAEAEGLLKTEGIPQAPVRKVTIQLKSGVRGALINPPTCGEFFTSYRFTPWSSGPPATGNARMAVDEGCDALGGFDPRLSAGSTDATAGSHAPFLFTLTRQDGEQNVASFALSLPEGLAATFAGVNHCEGFATETGACPPGSRIGRVVAAVGAGPSPLWVPQPGKRPTAVYLSGPYRGAPVSIVAVVPRQAGPFDFGDEVVRSAIYVDPDTARATAKTDPLPPIIEGIPISYRTLHVELDRPGFTLNPTGCALKRADATVTSSQGAVAHPSSTFAAVNCGSLGFKPSLSIRLFGATHRGAHPRLEAVLKARPGDANVGGARVALPSSEFVDNEHFNNVCTRVQFAAHECPAGSVYGFAVAKTPLFDFPLEGPVYLRSAPGRKLPDLVAALRGPAWMPIEVDLDGHVDSIKGRLRTSFEVVPDAPVTKFILRMAGGKKGLIQNSENLCLATHRAVAKFVGQNGKPVTLKPAVKTSCRSPKSKKRH